MGFDSHDIQDHSEQEQYQFGRSWAFAQITPFERDSSRLLTSLSGVCARIAAPISLLPGQAQNRRLTSWNSGAYVSQ
jgi:hypothetical protein